MTAVEILFRLNALPTEAVTLALASTRDVYGMRHLNLDRAAMTLRVEYDATRLTPAVVTRLVRQAGVQVAEELSLLPPQPLEEPVPTV